MRKKLFKIFLSFLILIMSFINSPIKVQADQNEILDSVFGSLINASQGGRGGTDRPNVRGMGSAIGGQRDGGRRLGLRTSRGPNGEEKVQFNPSLIDIDVLYNDYSNYITNNHYTNNIYTVPINRTIDYHFNELDNLNNPTGIIFDYNNYNGDLTPNYWTTPNHIYIELPKRFRHAYLELSNINMDNNYFRESHWFDRWGFNTDYSYLDLHDNSLFKVDLQGYFGRLQVRGGSAYPYNSVFVGNIYFSDFSINLDNIDVIHGADNLPTRQEFINNYTNTFNVQYDNETNQLVQNDTYYEYELNDFSDNSITINNDYVTNNYIVVEGDTIIEGDSKDYTTILERIINTIKALPQQIADKLAPLLPDVVTEAGTNIWDFLTSIVEAISGLWDTILTGLLSSLGTIFETLLGLFVPNQEQLDNLTNSFNQLSTDFTLKFSAVTDIGNSISGLFSSPKSLHDLTFNFNDEEVHVLPQFLAPQIAQFRTVFSGAVFLVTIIDIYKRFVGREDIIK